MKFEKLGNIADIIAGQSPPSSSYNSVGKGIPFFQGKADYGEKYPSVRYWCTEPTKISLPDDILISMRAPVGPVNINIVKSCIGRGLSAIRVKKDASRDYIYFWLKLNQHIVSAKETGSTFKAITQKILNEIVVPFPSYNDQVNISNLLSKAETLIEQRKQSIALLDEFLKSSFLEMFGEPVSNKKGWKKSALKEFARIRIGPFGSLLHREDYVQGGVPLVNPTHIQDGKIEIDLDLTISINKMKELPAYVMHEGDVVLGRRGEIGRCAVVTKNEDGFLCGTGSIFIRPLKGLQPIYLYNVISSASMRKVLENSAKGITMKNLNSGIVEEIKIPVPPIDLQTQFATIAIKTEALKEEYKRSLVELENLYGSLCQKAFKGELRMKEEELKMAAEPIVAYQKTQYLNIAASKKGFAKQVLGGKIVSLFKDDPNFTRIKFQKLQYLAEHIAEADLNWNYYRQAAGPYDNKFMHTVSNKLKENKWFEEKNYRFYPLAKVNDIERYYTQTFNPVEDRLSALFKAMKNLNEDAAEIAATLYAVWNNFIILKEDITDEKIISTFYEWSDRKKRYEEERLVKALAWMRKNDIVPVGFGGVIKEKK